MVTDPIADLIIQLKNAQAVKKDCVCIPFSQFKFAIANKLKQHGYVGNVSIIVVAFYCLPFKLMLSLRFLIFMFLYRYTTSDANEMIFW